MTRTGATSGSRWGRGGGGGGRGDYSDSNSSTSSGFPGSGRGWTAQLPAPRRPIWASSVDRSSTPSDKAVAWRDHNKEEADRLTESKSFLKNNKSFYQLSWPHPPFGILYPPSGSCPKVNPFIQGWPYSASGRPRDVPGRRTRQRPQRPGSDSPQRQWPVSSW